jgi:5'-deoxy-5'-methylthioadenosine phosphorylase
MLGVIGGSGVYGLAGLAGAERTSTQTPFGPPSSPLVLGYLDGGRVAFVARHGEDHSIAPHAVNYRANIDALRAAGVTRVLAVCTVGSLDPELMPGMFAVPDQIIDYTWGREQTFHGPGEPVPHVDFTEPYSPRWRSAVVDAVAEVLRDQVSAGAAGFSDGATYAAVQGPRFETAAEIRRFRNDGCSVIGMTGMPEAALAREAGLDYAAICPVANLAAGMAEGELTAEEVFAAVSPMLESIQAVVARLAGRNSAPGRGLRQ